MKLSDIRLEQVTEGEFAKMRNFWYCKYLNSNSSNDFNYARISAPIVSKDYDTLLREFLMNRHRDRISVNDRGNWRKFYARKMEESNIQEIAKIAVNDRIKKGHLELYFKTESWDRDDVKIKFLERDNLIISYDMRFPISCIDLFNCSLKTNIKRGTPHAP